MNRSKGSHLTSLTGPVLRTLVGCAAILLILGATAESATLVRFATFNASMYRSSYGRLSADLQGGSDAQAKVIAEIIQRVNPDVLLVNEFDYDPTGASARLFTDEYLAVGQGGASPILDYDYSFVAPSNTGVPSGVDLNGNGQTGDLGDTFGYGQFEGQYGMVLYSRFPIVEDAVRTFQTFLWADMPGALLPDNAATPAPGDWYSSQALSVFRLSSKSHWDVPVDVKGSIVHVLVSHPTPPVFDGPEDANGRRNHDEIRFWADYIAPGAGGYIYDDNGSSGGIDSAGEGVHFVVMGDQNADPFDGDSIPTAIRQLLSHSLINAQPTPSAEGGAEQAQLQAGANLLHSGDPAFDTGDFGDGPNAAGNLRVDYVLPSATLEIEASGIFWPVSKDPLFHLVGTPPLPGSDHRLVWVDAVVP